MILDVGRRRWPISRPGSPDASTLVWNGPLGAFETPPFDAGTIALRPGRGEADRRGQAAVASRAAATRWRPSPRPGWSERFSYVSTAGGAFLEWLEGKTLPGVAALMR